MRKKNFNWRTDKSKICLCLTNSQLRSHRIPRQHFNYLQLHVTFCRWTKINLEHRFVRTKRHVGNETILSLQQNKYFEVFQNMKPGIRFANTKMPLVRSFVHSFAKMPNIYLLLKNSYAVLPRLVAKMVETVLHTDAIFCFVCPVASLYPSSLSIFLCYPEHVQKIGGQHSKTEGRGGKGEVRVTCSFPVGRGNIAQATVGLGRQCLNSLAPKDFMGKMIHVSMFHSGACGQSPPSELHC